MTRDNLTVSYMAGTNTGRTVHRRKFQIGPYKALQFGIFTRQNGGLATLGGEIIRSPKLRLWGKLHFGVILIMEDMTGRTLMDFFK